MKSSYALIPTVLSSVSAWEYIPGRGFGVSSAYKTPGESLFETANQNPNATKSAPFQLNGQNFTFRVNVTELTPTGADTTVANPRVVNTVYDIAWPDSSSSLNNTIRGSEGLAPDEAPRFCVDIPFALFSTKATNNYEDDDNGDCSNALGSKCTDALKNHGYGANVACAGAGGFPSECLDVIPGGFGSSSLTGFNTSISSPLGFAFQSSPIYSAGNTTYFERETERLHVVVFSTTGQAPVCLRVKDDHVKKDSPAVAAAAGLWPSWLWYGIAAAMTGVAFLV